MASLSRSTVNMRQCSFYTVRPFARTDRPTEVLTHALETPLRQLVSQFSVNQYAINGVGKCGAITSGHLQAAFSNDLTERAAIGRHEGNTGCHGLDRWQPKPS